MKIEPTPGSEPTIAELIGQFGKAYTAFLHGQMEACGTTPARSRLLVAIYRSGTMKMAEIGADLGVTPRNVTKLVDALESEGLLERSAHPSDRRVTLVSLTSEGAKMAKAGMMRAAEANALFDRLSDRDRADLRRVLGRLLDELGRLPD